jgi:hypothetical protein
LLIREAEADDVADTDERALKVGCNMAQAFEIQRVTGERIVVPARPAQVNRREAPATHFSRSPLPVRSMERIGTSNMGPPPKRCKRNDLLWRALRPARFPGSAIRSKINPFCRI